MPEQMRLGERFRMSAERTLCKLEQGRARVIARMASKATLDSSEQVLWAAVVKQAIEDLLWDNRTNHAPQSAGEFLRSQNFNGIAMEIGLDAKDVRRWIGMEGILL